MSPTEQKILTALGAPLDAQYYVLFDQSAHLDYDWTSTFNEYFMGTNRPGRGVDEIFNNALKYMGTMPGYLYSICEVRTCWRRDRSGAGS